MTDNLRGAYKWEEKIYKDMIEQNNTERTTIGIVCKIMLETLFKLPDIPRSGKLLELGSGDGYNTVKLAGWDYEIIGIDVSESAVKIAQKRLRQENIQNAQVMRMDATCMTFEDNMFDVIVDATCLHCIVDLEDRGQVLSEVHRVLKPEGAFIGATMCQPYVGTLPDDLYIQDEIMYGIDVINGETAHIPARIIRGKDELIDEFSKHKIDVVWYKHEIIRPQPISYHFVYHAQKRA